MTGSNTSLRRRVAAIARRRSSPRSPLRYRHRIGLAERALLAGIGIGHAIMEGNDRERMPDLLDPCVPYERAIAELAARIAADTLTEQDRRTLEAIGAALEAEGRTITAKQYVALTAEVRAMY